MLCWCITQRKHQYALIVVWIYYICSMCFMSQNTCVKFDYTTLVIIWPNFHVSLVQIFIGLNISDWNKQVKFHIGVMDLDFSILEEKYATIIHFSINEDKTHHKAWEKSNRFKQMFMKMTITYNITTTLLKTKSFKEFMGLVIECSQTIHESFAETLVSTLTIVKFDDLHTMHEYVIDVINIVQGLRPFEWSSIKTSLYNLFLTYCRLSMVRFKWDIMQWKINQVWLSCTICWFRRN